MRYLNFKYSAQRFAWWRISFGAFLLYYSIRIWPYSIDLYSNVGSQGSLYGVTMNEHSYFHFPGLLLISASEPWVHFLCILQIVLSALFMIGYKRRIVSGLLWYVMASFFSKNPTTYSIELPYHGWILLSCVLIPEGDSFRKNKCDKNWHFPPILFWGAWLMVGLAYTYAGYTKFDTPRWWEGGATIAILKSYHGYLWFQSLLDLIPPGLFLLLDRSFLLAEFLALPGYLIPQVRMATWFITGFMHVPILLMMNVPQISLGMLLIHFFIFDENWIQEVKSWYAKLKSLLVKFNT